MAVTSHFLLVLAITCFFFLAKIAFADDGTATFYTPPYIPSACDGNKHEGVMIAAASDAFWDGGAVCGKMYSVRCTGPANEGDDNPCRGSDAIMVKIVDYCPRGCQGSIDLSQEVFAAIANPDAGIIKVEYNSV